MNQTKLLGVSMAVGLLGACGELAPTQAENAKTVTVSSAFLAGDIGYVQGINRAADDTVLQDYGDMTEVDVMVDNQDGNSAMALLQFTGKDGLAGLAQNPGNHSGQDANVDVTGCAGPSRGAWDYDEPADHTDVTVLATEQPGVFLFNFRSHWNASSWNGTPARDATGRFKFTVDGLTPAAAPAQNNNTVAVTAGNVGGTLGNVSISNTAQAVRAVDNGTTRTVTSTLTSTRVAQLVVTVPAGLRNLSSSSGAEASVTVVGRTGSSVGAWDFDAPADNVTVHTRPGDNGQTWVVYTASWGSQGSVYGSFALNE